MSRGRPTIDLSGQRFGKLELKQHLGRQYYRCLCDCGRVVTRRAYHMRSGAVAHCGCSPNPPLRRSNAVFLVFTDIDREIIRERAKANEVSDSVYLHRLIESVIKKFRTPEEKKPVQAEQATSQSSASSKSHLQSIIAILILVLTFSFTARGQVAVKSSPAEDALVSAAKELSTTQKSFDEIKQQAISALNTNQKTITDQVSAAQKDLQDKLRADKKYKPLLDNIDALQAKANAASQQAQQEFNQKSIPLQQTIQRDTVLVQSLVPIVKKEQSLPDTAEFDQEKVEWKDSGKKQGAATAVPK